jgi:hypothetical protein
LIASGVISNAQEDQGRRKTKNDDENRYVHHPGRRFELWQKNRRRLNQEPGNDRVSDPTL